MKHCVFVIVMMAIFCCGAYAQTETIVPDASLKAAGDGFCAAGLKGDVKGIFEFMFHPQMRQKVAEASGFQSEQEFLDNVKIMLEQELSENPLETCTIGETNVIECPSYAIAHFDMFGLKTQKCGKFAMNSKTANDEEPRTDNITAALVDGKWYAVMEDPATGIDYSDMDENDMGLRDFAKEFCAAMESQDSAAMEKLRMAGINPVDPSDHPDIMNWNGYMSRLTESWRMNPEPVSCSVMSTQNYGYCAGGTKEVYGAAGIEVETCGIIDLSVFMAKDNWYNGLSAVFIDGAWHIDTNDLIELSRIQE